MKKSRKSKSAKSKQTNKRLPMAALMQLNQAQTLADDDDWEGAHELLSDLNQRFPRRAEILEDLCYACVQTEDARGLQRAARALIEVAPVKEADWLPTLAQAYLMNAHPALALRTYDDYLQRFPDHELAEPTRISRDQTRAGAREMIESLPFPAATRDELALAHDQLNVALEDGELERAETLARQLLQAAPDFVPALNNLAQAQWEGGHRDAAIASARQVLEVQPDNVHALGNLTRFCVLQGQTDEAARTAQLLVNSDAPAFEGDFKKAEALAYVGDDAAITALYQRSKDAHPASDFLHLVAVAAARQGDHKKARRLWERSLETPGALAATAKHNLSNLNLPEGQRFAPWPFSFAQWFDQAMIQELEKRVSAIASRESAATSPTPAAREREQRAQRQMFAEFFARHPGLEECLIAQLDRGDVAGVQLALMCADMGRSPLLMEAVGEFALGRQGSDDFRARAAQIATDAGVLQPGLVTMWVKGEPRELVMTNFEITTDPLRPVSAGNRKAALAINAAIRAGDSMTAETLALAALEKYPDDVSLRFNLSQSLQHQGRKAEALEIVQAIHAQDPDYLFARVALALRHIEARETEAAHALLDPLMQARQFHVSEFSTWMHAHIELLLLEGKIAVAQSWLETWENMNEQLDYDHPALEMMQKRVKNAARGRR